MKARPAAERPHLRAELGPDERVDDHSGSPLRALHDVFEVADALDHRVPDLFERLFGELGLEARARCAWPSRPWSRTRRGARRAAKPCSERRAAGSDPYEVRGIWDSSPRRPSVSRTFSSRREPVRTNGPVLRDHEHLLEEAVEERPELGGRLHRCGEVPRVERRRDLRVDPLERLATSTSASSMSRAGSSRAAAPSSFSASRLARVYAVWMGANRSSGSAASAWARRATPPRSRTEARRAARTYSTGASSSPSKRSSTNSATSGSISSRGIDRFPSVASRSSPIAARRNP